MARASETRGMPPWYTSRWILVHEWHTLSNPVRPRAERTRPPPCRHHHYGMLSRVGIEQSPAKVIVHIALDRSA